MIKFITQSDFYAEGRLNGYFFQMNKVERGWTLAINARYVDTFDTYALAIAELRRVAVS